jgi:hypothetical protein
MFNVVQKTSFRLDQHTAELIHEKQHIYKIPVFTPNGKIMWKGCFSSPCTALAAVKDYSDSKKLPEEKHNELCNIFQTSLYRCDQEESSTTKDQHFTVVAAPPSSMLNVFGGPLTLLEFQKRYDEGGMMTKVYKQKLPDSEDGESGLESNDQVKGQPSDWNATVIPYDGKVNEEFVKALPSLKVETTRNLWNVINYVHELCVEFEVGSNSQSFVVTVHPEKKNVFAISDPLQWNDGAYNNLGSKLLGKQTIFGDAVVISKNPLVFSRKKSKPVKKEQTEPSTATQTETATTTTTTTTTDSKHKKKEKKQNNSEVKKKIKPAPAERPKAKKSPRTKPVDSLSLNLLSEQIRQEMSKPLEKKRKAEKDVKEELKPKQKKNKQ